MAMLPEIHQQQTLTGTPLSGGELVPAGAVAVAHPGPPLPAAHGEDLEEDDVDGGEATAAAGGSGGGVPPIAQYLSRAEITALQQPVRYIPRAPKLPKAVKVSGTRRSSVAGSRRQQRIKAKAMGATGGGQLAIAQRTGDAAVQRHPQVASVRDLPHDADDVETIDDLGDDGERVLAGGDAEGYASLRMRSRMQFVGLLHRIKAEPARYSSAVLLSEVMMRQAHVATRGQPAPNALRTAVACFSFDMVIMHLGEQYRHVFRSIREELFPAVFTDTTFNDGQLVQMSHLAVGSPLQYTIGAEAATVHRYMGCPLTFESLRDITADLQKYKQTCSTLAITNGKSQMVVRRAVLKWVTGALYFTFNHWRSLIQNTRQLRWLDRRNRIKYDYVWKKYMMMAAFFGWKALAGQSAVKRLQERAATLIYQLDNSNNQFTLQCFKTERYLATVDQLRVELEAVGEDLVQEKVKNTDASALLNVEHDKKIRAITRWVRGLEREVGRFIAYTEGLIARAAHTEYVDRRVNVESLVTDARKLALASAGGGRSERVGSTDAGKAPPPSEVLLLAWASGIVARSDLFDPPRTVTTYGHEWRDGTLFLVIMNHVAPSVCHLYPMQEINVRKRMQHVARYARALQFTVVPKVDDLLMGATDQVFVLLSQLFARYVDRDAARAEHEERVRMEADAAARHAAEVEEAARLEAEAAAAAAKAAAKAARRSKTLRSGGRKGSKGDATSDRAHSPPDEGTSQASGEYCSHEADGAVVAGGADPNATIGTVASTVADTVVADADATAADEGSGGAADRPRGSVSAVSSTRRGGSESEGGDGDGAEEGMDLDQLPTYIEQVRERLEEAQRVHDAAAEGQAKWTALADDVRKRAVEVAAARSAGRPVVVVDQRETARYSRVGKQRLKDLARNYSPSAQEAVNPDATVYTFDQMVELTAALLHDNFQDVRTVFQYYTRPQAVPREEAVVPVSPAVSPDSTFNSGGAAGLLDSSMRLGEEGSLSGTIGTAGVPPPPPPPPPSAPPPAVTAWGFWRMCCDMRIMEPHSLTKSQVLTVFRKSLAPASFLSGGGGGGVGAGPADGDGDEAGLGPTEFAEALIRLADMRVPSEATLQGRLRCLLHQYCFPYAARPIAVKPGREWRAEVYTAGMQSMLDHYVKDLAKIHAHYSVPVNAAPHQAHAAQAPALNLAGFVKLLNETQVLTETFGEHEAQQIFRHAQGPLEHAPGDSDLVLQEFAEAVVACAMYRHPSPFIPLVRRVEHLITQAIVAVRPRLKQSGVKLELDTKVVPLHGA